VHHSLPTLIVCIGHNHHSMHDRYVWQQLHSASLNHQLRACRHSAGQASAKHSTCPCYRRHYHYNHHSHHHYHCHKFPVHLGLFDCLSYPALSFLCRHLSSLLQDFFLPTIWCKPALACGGKSLTRLMKISQLTPKTTTTQWSCKKKNHCGLQHYFNK
jgi:hypothetical protein